MNLPTIKQRTHFFAALMLCAAASAATAQTFRPLDPLVRPKHGAGGYSFTVSANYAPTVVYGQAGTYTSNDLGLGLSGVYNVTDQFSVSGSVRGTASLQQQLTEEGASGMQELGVSAPSLGVQYDFLGEYAPTLSAEVSLPFFDQPWRFGVGVSASLLRDPLMVDAQLSYRYTAALPEKTLATHDISAGLGLGFVVNDSFTLRGEVTQSWTVGRIIVPSTSLGTSLGYKVSEQSSVRASVGVSGLGGETSWQTGLSYTFRK